jgi:hypothetical protein
VCDAVRESVVKSRKLEATVEGSSNKVELSINDLGNKTMEGSVKTTEYFM